MNKNKNFSLGHVRDFLFISDLDGTLLLPDGTFPKEYKVRLNKLIDDGLKFTIATARNYDSAHPILCGLNIRYPVILFNGVYLAEFQNGKILEHTQFIDKKVVYSMLEIAKTHSIEPFIYTFGKNHQVYYRQTHNDGSLAYLNSLKKNDRVKQILRFEFHKNENVSGFLLIGAKESLEPAYKILKDKHSNHLNLYFAEDVSMKGYFWLQSFHQQATKGNMIKKLSSRFNFSLQKTLVFGDYLNDLDMFQVAGHSVAVENALPEVKQSANQIIGHNSNGAVLDFLESIWYNV